MLYIEIHKDQHIKNEFEAAINNQITQKQNISTWTQENALNCLRRWTGNVQVKDHKLNVYEEKI